MDFEALGTRGEGWFAAQAVATFLCVFPPAQLEPVAHVSGLAAVVGGAYVCVTSLGALGSALSPFPKPPAAAELVTDGAFAATRHPTYTGLLVLAYGVALQTGSSARFAFALVLTYVMHQKATVEESFLRDKFGASYADYQASVPMLWPTNMWFQSLVGGGGDREEQ